MLYQVRSGLFKLVQVNSRCQVKSYYIRLGLVISCYFKIRQVMSG